MPRIALPAEVERAIVTVDPYLSDHGINSFTTQGGKQVITRNGGTRRIWAADVEIAGDNDTPDRIINGFLNRLNQPGNYFALPHRQATLAADASTGRTVIRSGTSSGWVLADVLTGLEPGMYLDVNGRTLSVSTWDAASRTITFDPPEVVGYAVGSTVRRSTAFDMERDFEKGEIVMPWSGEWRGGPLWTFSVREHVE